MTQHIARANTGEKRLSAGEEPVDTRASACGLLAAALACCVRESLTGLLDRHGAGPLAITATIEPQQAAVVALAPRPDDAILQQKLERAILRCPVAAQLHSPPRIEWHA